MLESLLGVLAVVGVVPTAAADPIIGATLAGAQATAFYTDYKFDEIARHTDSAGQVWIQFRPATTYKNQVKLWLRLNPAGVIDQATLDLARGLVEPEATKAIARAMANIFLLAATPAADLPAVEPLANTIWRDRDPSRFDPSVAGVDRDARVVAGYRVFLGFADRYRDVLSVAWVLFQNLPIDGDLTLRMSVGT